MTFVTGQPELLIATHPNTIMTDGEDQIHASRFTDDISFQNCYFFEIFNAWGRHFKPWKYWLATQKWDRILSTVCRVLAVADDDSMLDFPGVEKSACCRPELKGIGLPNMYGNCGFGWNMVFMDGVREPIDTSDLGTGSAEDKRGHEARQRFTRAMRQGRYYCTTGVTITAVHV